MTQPTVTINTDGGCSPNPGPGGWAAILTFGTHEKIIKGAERDTTNQRMELTAAIEALRTLNKSCRVTLRTDSRYLQQGITEWLPNWVANGWRTADKKPVRNRDLWEALHLEMLRHNITPDWIRGHAGDEMNERVHRLVVEARNSL
jgi:ribonuclease HI